MNEIKNPDYLKFIFHKIRVDLSRFNVSVSDKELIEKLFGRLITSENLLRDVYILSHIKELKNIGKYFIFILKKLEDNIINFDNLLQNITADTEFIQSEILNYLSNPKPREEINYRYEEDMKAEAGVEVSEDEEIIFTDETKTEDGAGTIEKKEIEEKEIEEKEIYNFKKNYLELIQSESNTDDEIVYELPKPETADNDKAEIKTEPEASEEKGEVNISENIVEQKITEDIPESIVEEKIEEQEDAIVLKKEIKEEEVEIEIRMEDEREKDEERITENEEQTEDIRIPLSEEIQKEIDLMEKESKATEDIEAGEEIETIEEVPTNAAFLEYENILREKNELLEIEFDKMINVVNIKPVDETERTAIIKKIIETCSYLETVSRKMSLEIISNIYQTITLSFEKISDGKYDISESTINLFKKGLLLVHSLVKGEDYFGYKEILKSIENIRNLLLEDIQKRNLYLKQKKEKQELESKLSAKYPDEFQRTKVTIIKQLIKDTEERFNSLDKIYGEYQIYEALRNLSGNLNNFKEIVKLSKELELEMLVKLSEASYIFIKFLQNYRINPVTIEIKEIFGYIVYNLKSILLDKRVDDIDVFISYLNDPVKIFSKTGRGKK